MTTPKPCEGDCGEHGDTVKLVRVTDPWGTDWGLWWYCDEAIRKDRANKFEVIEVPDDKT